MILSQNEGNEGGLRLLQNFIRRYELNLLDRDALLLAERGLQVYGARMQDVGLHGSSDYLNRLCEIEVGRPIEQYDPDLMVNDPTETVNAGRLYEYNLGNSTKRELRELGARSLAALSIQARALEVSKRDGINGEEDYAVGSLSPPICGYHSGEVASSCADYLSHAGSRTEKSSVLTANHSARRSSSLRASRIEENKRCQAAYQRSSLDNALQRWSTRELPCDASDMRVLRSRDGGVSTADGGKTSPKASTVDQNRISTLEGELEALKFQLMEEQLKQKQMHLEHVASTSAANELRNLVECLQKENRELRLTSASSFRRSRSMYRHFPSEKQKENMSKEVPGCEDNGDECLSQNDRNMTSEKYDCDDSHIPSEVENVHKEMWQSAVQPDKTELKMALFRRQIMMLAEENAQLRNRIQESSSSKS